MRPPHASRHAGVVVLVVLAMLLAGCGGFGTPSGYVVEVRFPRTFNLFPGSPVQVLGIERGIVEKLEVQEGDETVLATLRIDHDTDLPADVRAFILTDALLGERIVTMTPPYDGEGPTLPPNTQLDETGDVPAEFDELLDALNGFVEGIQGGDLPRLVDNLAEVLDGNGENLGETLAATRDAINVLRDVDQDIIQLASKLSGVNETLNTRRTQLTDVVADFAELSQVLADQRVPLNQSLTALARLADETGRLLDTNRTLLERDVATLTSVTRTAVRNVDHVSNLMLSSAELFRAAERVIDRERNWLPLVNNTDQLSSHLLETTQNRIGALCLREGLPTDVCQELTDLVDGIVPDTICLPPLLDCGEEADTGLPLRQPFPDAVGDVLEDAPEEVTEDPEEQGAVEELVDELVGNLGRLGGGGLSGTQPGGDQ